jgi:hypothetical protein
MTKRFVEGVVAVNANVTQPQTIDLQQEGDTEQITGAGVGVVPQALRDNGSVTVVEYGGTVHKTVFTLTAAAVPVTDALAYAGLKLYDFPEGRILVLGATASLQWAVTTDRSTTINDSASLTWALGTVTASNITLASTMVNLLPKATKVLAAATTALNTASTNALVASAQFDGTTTAIPAILNVGFETNTDIDADGTLAATGSITVVWISCGDY